MDCEAGSREVFSFMVVHIMQTWPHFRIKWKTIKKIKQEWKTFMIMWGIVAIIWCFSVAFFLNLFIDDDTSVDAIAAIFVLAIIILGPYCTPFWLDYKLSEYYINRKSVK